MSYQMTRDEADRLKKDIKNYNQKIRRLAQKGYDVPTRQSFVLLKEKINSKDAYKMQQEILRGYSARYSEKKVKLPSGVEMSQAEVSEIEARVKFINARRKERLEEYNRIADTTKYGKFGTEKQRELRPKKSVRDIKPANLEKYLESVYKQSLPEYEAGRYELYRENYLRAFDNVFGGQGSWISETEDTNLTEYSRRVRELIKRFPAEELYRLGVSDERLSLSYLYDIEDAIQKLDMIMDALSSVTEV